MVIEVWKRRRNSRSLRLTCREKSLVPQQASHTNLCNYCLKVLNNYHIILFVFSCLSLVYHIIDRSQWFFRPIHNLKKFKILQKNSPKLSRSGEEKNQRRSVCFRSSFNRFFMPERMMSLALAASSLDRGGTVSRG